jgi:hypothetical protein
MKTPTQKLSKADGDTSVRDLRAAGWAPDAVVGRAAALAGLIDSPHPVPARDAPDMVRIGNWVIG